MDKRFRRKLTTVSAQIIEAYKNGETYATLAKNYNVSEGTIGNLLKLFSIERRPRGRRKKNANK